jgi:hypothetical protein
MLSVCEVLDHRLRYDGKTVIVFGRISATTEGQWLTADCGGRLQIDGSEWGYDISLTYVVSQTQPPPALPSGFRWNRKKLIAALPENTGAMQWRDDPDCQYRAGWAAVFGRLETQKVFDTFRDASGGMHHVGFGHLGGSPAQLIWPEGGTFCLASQDEEFGPAGVDPAQYLWNRIRQALQSDGPIYFERAMKGALVPGPEFKTRKLKGILTSSEPPESPNVLILKMTEAGASEVTLRLSAPFGKPIAAGTPVEFEGIATQFSPVPLMLTFDVQLQDLIADKAN